ncbi:MAG: hypothetical protein ACK5M3_15900 [Dysgonomonas sp.]
MSKEILVPSDVKKQLAADFKTSNVSVWKALTYQTESSFANMIRAAALERGGRIYDGSPDPKRISSIDCETTFDTANHLMIQVFSDRVKIVVDMANEKVVVYIDNEPKVVAQGKMSVSELMTLQLHAQEAAKQLKK